MESLFVGDVRAFPKNNGHVVASPLPGTESERAFLLVSVSTEYTRVIQSPQPGCKMGQTHENAVPSLAFVRTTARVIGLYDTCYAGSSALALCAYYYYYS